MSVIVGSIEREHGIPPTEIVRQAFAVNTIAVFASSGGVELVADPSTLSPLAARTLAALLNVAADQAEKMKNR